MKRRDFIKSSALISGAAILGGPDYAKAASENDGTNEKACPWQLPVSSMTQKAHEQLSLNA